MQDKTKRATERPRQNLTEQSPKTNEKDRKPANPTPSRDKNPAGGVGVMEHDRDEGNETDHS